MVENILRATARVLLKGGYEELTTNRVAEAAGVSVGSLYQYFPSKEALLAALIDRHEAQALAALNVGPEVLMLSLPEVTRALIEALLRAQAVNPPLHQILLAVAPRLGKERDALRDRGMALVTTLIELHRGHLRPFDRDLVAFIIVQALDALCQRVTMSRPDLLQQSALVDELCQLVLRYVTAPDSTPRS